MIKRLTAVLLCLCFFCFSSVPVSGDVVNDFVVRVLEGDEDGYTYNSGVLTFASDGAYEVSMADGVDVATDVIVVASGVTAEVRINGLNIDPSNDSAFSVAAGAVCELVLTGDSEFIETEAYANVHVPADAAITIVGEGSLNVINMSEGAGIGGGLTSSGGEIIINGGIIYAESDEGAGIGSGQYSGYTQNIGTKVTINGGTITAKALQGSGIGGGFRGIGGEVYIRGGSVITTLPYFNAAAVTYTNPNFNVGANETPLTTSVSGALSIMLSKMDNAVYPEPVELTASILDASSPSGMAAIEAIDR
jgi:hypothetical protein